MPAASPEKERLAAQYAAKKAAYGWKSPVPDIIDLSRIQTALDIAAGTCIWSLDLAATLHAKNLHDVQIYACDINTGFLPADTDVTKSFAEGYHGMFDLVHISLLVVCLTEDGWKAALANVQKLLKPGGLLMLDEFDLVLFRNGQYSRPVIGFALQNKFVIGLSFRLREMLEEAGLTVEKVQAQRGSVGKTCRIHKGADGGSPAAFEGSTAEVFESIVARFAAIMLEKGTAEAPSGHHIVNEEELEGILAEVHEGLKTEGAYIPGACYVARKS
ncbi:hypothetical protein DFH07DRAFT_965887 [Mycena maculata]|uniref:Methyltransferase domain-containing protein n=1 Tax=Mycena maculata TaxID=230809 RepID=A0AAD7ICW0_9AGAR|nr:hypothetical protein DFH07DRAFT_965887 [Mycena maculata]